MLGRPIRRLVPLLVAVAISGASLARAASFEPGLDTHNDDSWWDGFGPGVPNGRIYATVVWNGHVVVGGEFQQIGGETYNHIAMWDGGAWQHLSTGMNNT